MQKITTAAELKTAIQELELKQATEWSLLKSELTHTYSSFTPLNIIKNTFREVTEATGFKDNLLGSVIGLAAGYLSKGLIGGGSPKAIRNIAGSLLQVEVSTVIARNFSRIKAISSNIAGFFRRKKKPTVGIVD